MRFTAWLWEQLDYDGPMYRTAKMCWDDVNNGCASTRFSAQNWIDHFESKHLDKKDILIDMTFTAYTEYLKEVKK